VPRRLAILCALLAAAAVLGGCGNKEEEVFTAETEGAYLDVGELRYQVQISRQLNPADIEDRAYLNGVPVEERVLERGQSWFAIFVRVENPTEEPHRAADEFELEDTQDQIYKAIELPPQNPFAYNGGVVQPEDTLPPLQSVAQQNETIFGQLVLFKVDVSSFENRPLELKILSPEVPQTEATLALDV
jgi:hypothetical protein